MAAMVSERRAAAGISAAALRRTPSNSRASSARMRFLRTEHLLLPLLQLRRHVALGVGERLLADVVRRHLLEVGTGDLEVVAEYLVEADLQRVDAGALALPRLQAGDEVHRAIAEGAQLVQLGIEARADDAAVGERRRRLFGDRGGDQLAQLGKRIEGPAEGAEQRGAPLLEARLQPGDVLEGCDDGQQFTWGAPSGRHLHRQPLQVSYGCERCPNLAPQTGIPHELGHGLLSARDLLALHQRRQDPAPQHASAHRRQRLVEHRQQRLPSGAPA